MAARLLFARWRQASRSSHVHNPNDADVVGRAPQVELTSLVIIRPGRRRAGAAGDEAWKTVSFDVDAVLGCFSLGFRSGRGSNRRQKGCDAANQRGRSQR